MSESAKKISREAFYERIWTTPIVRLGKELGYSYLEMVELCRQLNVPRPEGGYWYRLQQGKTQERSALPPSGPDTPLEITLGSRVQPAAVTPAPEVSNVQTPPFPSQIKAAEKDESKVEAASVDDSKAKQSGVITYTRRELYNAIWSQSCQQLAAELGISDVALAKTCKRMGIPRPSLGYWARVAAGEKLAKTPLPDPQGNQDKTVTFDVEANRKRREEWHATAGDLDSLAVNLTLPSEDMELHPLAQRHLRALERKKPNEGGFVTLRARDVFCCDLTPATLRRCCRALHTLVVELEARGFHFKSGADQNSSLRVVKGDDHLTISCSESREQFEREPTPEEKRQPSWTWQLKGTKPTGQLSFEVAAHGLRGRRTWTESSSKPLEEILGIIVEKVEWVFRSIKEQRQLEIEAAKRREEAARREAVEQARREREEVEQRHRQQHEDKLAGIAETRRDNLFAAAQAWFESGYVNSYLDDCERRWRQAGELSVEQSAWLGWAREEAATLIPTGYPDPATDGRLDRKAIPMGGPYPTVKPLREKKASPEPPPEVRTVYVQQHQQYPFWIKNR